MVGLATPAPDAPAPAAAHDAPGPAAPHGPADELAAAATYLETAAGAAGLGSRVAGAPPADAARLLASALSAGLDAAPHDADNDAALDGCMQVLLAALARAGMDPPAVEDATAAVAAGDGRARARLEGLVAVYNRVGEGAGAVRYAVLMKIVVLAARTNLVGMIVNTVLGGVGRFMNQWACRTEERRAMYAACADACGGAGMPDRAFTYNVKRLELYAAADEAELVAVEPAAVHAIVVAIRLPDLYRFDTLLELAPVRRLAAAGGDVASLHQLLTLFVKDDLDVYTAFASENAALLAKYEIDPDAAADKMRLLTFASLGIDAQELSYATIAAALQIEDSQVEDWVIRAISSGLVDAKINQLKSNVAVYRSTQRMFTREEWQPLSERINIWKENIGDLLTNLRATRQDSHRAAAEAFTARASA